MEGNNALENPTQITAEKLTGWVLTQTSLGITNNRSAKGQKWLSGRRHDVKSDDMSSIPGTYVRQGET